MKMNKQTIQVVILSVLMIFLISYGLMQSGTFNQAPPPAPPTTDAKPDDKKNDTEENAPEEKVVRKKGNPADLLWIDVGRLNDVVNEVKGGRDPFEDLLTPPPVIIPPTDSMVRPLPSDNGTVKPLPALDDNISQKVTLFWLTAGELRKLLANEGFRLIKVKSVSANSHTVTLTGLRVDVDDALKIIRETDKEPPKPKFRLIGVLKSSDKNFVVLAVNGQQYELFEGDTINKLGWSVAAINDSGVRLTKGRQTILLPIGGQP